MAKRHQALIPLTHDHHHALAQARQMRIASEGTDEQSLEQGRQFLEFFRAHTIEHFREEEEIVFPVVIEDDRARPLLTRAVVDHLEIHALVAGMGREIADGHSTRDSGRAIASHLERHVRFEEGEVFPMLERLASEEQLTEISESLRSRPQAG
jgi:hemerythrin-like domain-containing protein